MLSVILIIFNILIMSKFFCDSPIVPDVPYKPTIVLVSELSDDNKYRIVPKCVETLLEPLSALSFEDFSLKKLLSSGVSYKSLLISPDMRMDHDVDFDSFDSHLEEISNELFNSQN